MVKLHRAFSITQAHDKAVEFAREWLGSHPIAPEGVELTEEQFAALMDAVLRGLMEAYAAGYVTGVELP